MAMLMRVVSRATRPHLPTLAASLAPLLSVANAGSFHLRYQDGSVMIEQNSFTGVNLSAVDAAVASAPAHSDKLDAKAQIDGWPLALLAAFDSVRDAVNIERARHSAAAVTRQQFIDSIKTKVDNWS